MKECTKCHISKEAIDFYRSKFTNDGLQSWCIICFKEQSNKSRKTFPDRHHGYAKKWRDANIEHRRIVKRTWDRKRMQDPLHRLSNNIRGNMYQALKAKKAGRKWEALVGYTLEDLIKHLEGKFTADITWDNYGNGWQVDHITPKSWFRYTSTDDPQFRECWALKNLQPKLKVDNIRKGNRFAG